MSRIKCSTFVNVACHMTGDPDESEQYDLTETEPIRLHFLAERLCCVFVTVARLDDARS